ncbi:SusC/RagA family TonB-linked outer membrane protein [Pedobacter jamesrossensis]|uniref:SusC/RagA family TonB-linked outer membrane protein n=1 Tax=Pedobacter jamesrossensis TaxID=1908238 RepID=A0ABV8NRK5_9SPHI
MNFSKKLSVSTVFIVKALIVQLLIFIFSISLLTAGEKVISNHKLVESTIFFQQNQKQITITGYVYDDANLPIPGASVGEKGTKNITQTNNDGFFTLKVSSPASVIVVGSVSFITKEVKVGTQNSIKVFLQTSVSSLDDVVIVGYGVQKKATNTGAQSSIESKTLVQSPVANISNSLVGRVAGLSAVQASGEPGADQSTIRIRGVGTFGGSQDPLILVDGIQVNNYNNIDPNEIENITVLKDASSTAVFGIRGANGVILITTKAGKIGAPSISYTFNYAINKFTDIRENMNSFDYANSFNQALFNDAYINDSQASFTPRFSQSDLAKYRSGEDPVFFPNVNWYDLIFKPSAGQQQHNLNIRGGTEKVKYFISAGFFDQEALFNTNAVASAVDQQLKYRRYNFRSNLDFEVTKKFKVTLRLSSQTEDRSGPNVANTRGIIDNVLRATPLSSPGIIDGKLISLSGNGSDNPLIGLYNNGYRTRFNNTLNGSIRLDHNLDFITPGLTTHAEVAYQNFNAQQTTYTNSVVLYRAIRGANGATNIVPLGDEQTLGGFAVAPDKNNRLTSEFAFDYKRKFGNHYVTGLALYNQIRATDPSYFDLVANTYQSVVGRATYDFKSKYLVEIALAYNGSENFAPGQRFGFFPSFSAGWVPTQEGFFPKNKILSFLKIRGSYGEVGNDQIGSNFLQSNNRFLYRPTAFNRTGGYYTGLNLSGYRLIGGRNGTREGRGSNPNLTWERAIKSNIGFDANLLDERFNLTFDIFQENRDNILATFQTIGGNLGFQAAPENFGKMKNRGLEFDLGFKDKIGEFNYFIRGNYSFARNTILEQDEITRTFSYQNRTGNRFGQGFGLIADGFFNSWEEVNDANRPFYDVQNNKLQPGDVKFRDVNGDGIVNFDDVVPIGYSDIPEVTYGFNIGGTFKGFDFSVLFQGTDNVSLQYSRRTTQAFFDAIPTGAVNTLLESWTPERYAQGLPINFPRFAVGNNTSDKNNYRTSTLFYADASYLRLKNVEIGYSLSSKVFQKLRIKSARFYITANNLFTWSKVVKGIDPENPTTNANEEPYPLVKTVNFGTSINF